MLYNPGRRDSSLDQALLWSALLLLSIGLVMVYSASVAMADAERFTGFRPGYFLVRHGVYLEYNDRAWEPFWSACEDYDLVLATHVGLASPGHVSGPESLALTSIEDGGYFARRAIWWMIFGGVFERHPA